MILSLTVSWLGLNALKLIGPKAYRSRYFVLTPPFMRTQRVFDRHARILRKYSVRGPIDTAVLHQTYLNEHFRLDNLLSWNAIKARYGELQRRGVTPLIVDCGANIGLSTAYFADQFPEATIVAVEPDSQNILQARKNCPRPNVHFVQAAVSCEPGRGSIVDPGGGPWAFQVRPDPNGAVSFLSINDVLSQYPKSAPFIIKIDIEGFEKELFARNTEWFDAFHVAIVELHDWMLPGKRTALPFLRVVGSLDRDFVYRGENVFSISNRR